MASDGIGTLQPKTFGVIWKIERFFADCQKLGDFYESPIFPMQYPDEMTKWRLKVYPKGDKEEAKNYVSLYLVLASENKFKVTLNYQLSIASEHSVFPKKNLTHTFEGPYHCWGFSKFIEQNVVKCALIDDSLTLLCEATFHSVSQDATESFNGYNEWIDKSENGFSEYEKLFESGSFSDVTFNVQDKQINVHKAIISCRSPVFKAMFEHEMKEKNESFVNITDIDYDVMKELFRFLYSRKVRDIKKIAYDLLIAADKYSVMELKALCEKTLNDSLTVDNVIQYLILAGQCDTIHLKKRLIKFFLNNMKDIVKKNDFKSLFKDLDREVVSEIMEALAQKG